MDCYEAERAKKWISLQEDRIRCKCCMFDAPREEICCKHHCGTYSFCIGCDAKCRAGNKACERKG